MEIPKALLGAILLGITVHTTSCEKSKTQAVQPITNEDVQNGSQSQNLDCPACGMG